MFGDDYLLPGADWSETIKVDKERLIIRMTLNTDRQTGRQADNNTVFHVYFLHFIRLFR